MKAMILAAGDGIRARPLTLTIPQSMLPLAGKPIMESIIEHLYAYGVDEIMVNTSYLACAIESYFRDGSHLGVQVAYSFEGRLNDGVLEGQSSSSASGMKRAQEFSGFFDQAFIVVRGNALADVDISSVVSFHKQREAMATLVLKKVAVDEVPKHDIVEVSRDGRVLALQAKPKQEEAVSRMANAGIYVFEPEIFRHIPPHTEFDIDGDLLPAILKTGERFFAIDMPFQWLNIRSVSDYWDATRLILSGGVCGYRLPGREIRPGVRAGVNVSADWDALEIVPPVFIGGSTKIETGAKIVGPTVIGAGCLVEAGAVVSECIIDDYTRITSAASIEQKLIFGGRCIEPDGSSFELSKADISWLINDARSVEVRSELHEMLFDLANSHKAA